MEDETFRKIIETAENHKKRAAEGRRLLEQGRPLSEMDTEPIGLSIEETVARRQGFVNNLKNMKDDLLSWVFGNTMYQLHRRYEDEDKGTSELEWQVNAFKDEFTSRGLDVPKIDFEAVKSGLNRRPEHNP